MKSYTVKEVAALLQVDPETVRRWIRSKKLVSEKSSNKDGNRILESELKAFLKASPKYAASVGALLVGSAITSTVMLATFATEKAIESAELENARVDSKAIINFVQSEISSRQALITRKEDSIHQIEAEIAAEQTRINELKAILESIIAGLQVSESLDQGGTKNGQ
jgi:excisionase family DNA binding protein